MPEENRTRWVVAFSRYLPKKTEAKARFKQSSRGDLTQWRDPGIRSRPGEQTCPSGGNGVISTWEESRVCAQKETQSLIAMAQERRRDRKIQAKEAERERIHF